MHQAVLQGAVLQALDLRAGDVVLDGTVGYGGHAEAMLPRVLPGGRLVGLDRDPHALVASSARLGRFADAVSLRRGRFGDLRALAGDAAPFDAILLDLGVSSPQIDDGARGFSFLHAGPVDMRMDPDQPVDAGRWLEQADEDELVRVLFELGEEPRARRIARAILDGRPWGGTDALAEAIARLSGYPRGRTHPATRTFQALRMVVNDELGELERALGAGPDLLAPGGRMAVISFHSLEDRRVKEAFRVRAGVGAARDGYGHPLVEPDFAIVGRKGISGKDADAENPRARSARLRVLERIDRSNAGRERA